MFYSQFLLEFHSGQQAGQFKPLIIVVVFPLSHVPRYTWPWLVKGTDKGVQFECSLIDRLKWNDQGELHEKEGSLQCVQEDTTGGSQTDLQQLLYLLGREIFRLAEMYDAANVTKRQQEPFSKTGQQRGSKQFRSRPGHSWNESMVQVWKEWRSPHEGSLWVQLVLILQCDRAGSGARQPQWLFHSWCGTLVSGAKTLKLFHFTSFYA